MILDKKPLNETSVWVFVRWLVISVAIGLAAVFCGVTNCPITSLLLSIELFGSQGLILFATAIAATYMLSGYSGLYGEQKIVYSKLKAEFIDVKAK